MEIPTREEIKSILSMMYNYYGDVMCNIAGKPPTAKEEVFFMRAFIQINEYAKSLNKATEKYSIYPSFLAEDNNLKGKNLDDFAFDFGFVSKR